MNLVLLTINVLINLIKNTFLYIYFIFIFLYFIKKNKNKYNYITILLIIFILRCFYELSKLEYNPII